MKKLVRWVLSKESVVDLGLLEGAWPIMETVERETRQCGDVGRGQVQHRGEGGGGAERRQVLEAA